jgi:hypothetical protein
MALEEVDAAKRQRVEASKSISLAKITKGKKDVPVSVRFLFCCPPPPSRERRDAASATFVRRD